MKNALTKKVVIVFSVLVVTVLAAIGVSFATGNSSLPRLSDPDGIFYERTDTEGNVLYSITNKELFDEIKNNDGIDQLLYLIDEYLLQDYVSALTSEEIAEKIKLLTYGTVDDDVIAELEPDVKTEYETTFEQSMILAGYQGQEEDYARIVLAREAYARYTLDTNGDIGDMDVASEFVTSYFEDIKAIKIRFTSSTDVSDVLRKFNLVTFSSTTLREYLGFVYKSETVTWDHDNDSLTANIIADAYITVTPYYFNNDGDILGLNDVVAYEKGVGSTYASGTNEYTLEVDGDLVDANGDVVIAAALLFANRTAAATYKQVNDQFFTVTKVDAFDEDEEAEVRNVAGILVYTVGFDQKIYDLTHKDVTSSTDIVINKTYKIISNMGTVTANNSRELTNAEVLSAYIQMYNYVYAEQRDPLPTDADAQDLIASDNAYLTHNFTATQAIQSSLAVYMFKSLNLDAADAIPYAASGKSYAGANDTAYYLVYKLEQPAKVDAYQIMLDLIEANIHLPKETVTNLVLPTTGWYNAKITWTSEDESVISDTGVVTLPATTATEIDLTYKITANGVTRTDKITVKVLVSGETSVIDDTDPGVAPTFKSILNDPTLYGRLYVQLLDEMMTDPENAAATINAQLAALRTDCGLKLYDEWLIIDYQETDAAFVGEEKGSKTLIASLTKRPGFEIDALTDAGFEVTADELFAYALTKNAALYVLYASQYEELLYSPFFTEAFGTQKNLERNNTDRMKEMFTAVSDAKDYYAYLQQLYASYGMEFTYASFSEYAYTQYGTKTELQLLEYFVKGELQPYLIAEAIDNYGLVDLLYDTVADYYDNFFSLDVTHVIIFLDFDENGTPDDYFAYVDSLDVAEADAYETKLAGFEAAITEYLDDEENDFESLVNAFRAATREDATWGEFKRFGFNLLTEDLNFVDEEDDTITYSLNYSGEYGVKETYVQEYVDALVALYQEYRLEQNVHLTNMMSSLVTTVFGQHLILVEPGDDFNGFSAEFTEEDPANPVYSAGSENASGQPTLDQLKLYALYYFYNTVYDLKDGDIEATYGITVPSIPASVKAALTFLFDDLCANLYVVGTLNVTLCDRLAAGTMTATAYGLTDAEFKAALAQVQDVYYQALFGKYEG